MKPRIALTKKAEQYFETYSGKKLLEKHTLDADGVWQICGEDPNCDFGGTHGEPYLETVAGKLGEVVAYGVELPGFWTWGGGGSFRKVEVKKVTIAALDRIRAAELLQKKKEIETELAKLGIK